MLMNSFNKPSIAIKLAIVTLVIFAAFIGNVKAADQGVKFSDERVLEYVNKASAIVYAPSLTRGSLLQMRGAFGSARFIRKADDNSWCDAAPLRLLFGDFSGISTGISSTDPVVLIVLNPSVADKLARGQDIVGDDITLLDIDGAVSGNLGGVDVIVAGAASAESGLVLNPGKNFLNDIFGASSVDNNCGHISAESALDAFEAQN